jgi:uncharacterized membrane protein YesL
LVTNVLWLLISLFLITLPAATGALFYIAHCVIREERALDPEYAQLSDFWTGLRRYGWRSTLLMLLNLLVFFVIGVALWFYGGSQVEVVRWLVGPVALIGIVWLGAQLYLFPLLIVNPERSTLDIARHAALTAIGHPMYTLILFAILLIVTLVSTVLAGPVFLVLFSLLAVTQTMALRFIRVQRGEIPPARTEVEEDIKVGRGKTKV